MCGRFTLTSKPEEIARRFELDEPPAVAARYNIAPGQDVAVIRQRRQTGARVCEPRRWGLVPSWASEAGIGSRLINARAETLAEKPAFRRAFQRHRCLLPADGFYEWRSGSRQPHFVALETGGPVGLAGIFERWHGPDGEPLDSCAIVTTAAADDLRALHDRMPLILAPEDFALWLDPEVEDAERLRPLLAPWTRSGLRIQPVSRRVNDVRLDEPSLLEPVPAEPVPSQLGLGF